MLSVECLITPEHGYGTLYRSCSAGARDAAEADQKTGDGDCDSLEQVIPSLLTKPPMDDLGAYLLTGHQPNISGIADILVLPICLFCVYCNDLLRI